MLPRFGLIDLDRVRGKFRAAGSGIGKIGVNYLPPMNAVGPVPVHARVFRSARLTGAAITPLPGAFSWANGNDVRNRLGGDQKITGPPNQGPCGSCYAVSSSTVLADRWAIAKRRPPPFLSAVVALSCSASDAKCDGGLPFNQGEFYEAQGLPLDDCAPYAAFCPANASECGNAKETSCPSCSGDTRWKAEKGSTAYLTDLSNGAESDSAIAANIANIKQEIYDHGPVVGCFLVYADFQAPDASPKSWPGGIYKHDPAVASIVGGHAIAIVGWCDNYWIIRNSWGDHWNEGGYFRAYNGLSGNKGLGFDHTISMGGSLLGGTITFRADAGSGDMSYKDEVGKIGRPVFTCAASGGGGGSSTSSRSGSLLYVLVFLVFIMVAWFWQWWKKRR